MTYFLEKYYNLDLHTNEVLYDSVATTVVNKS